ncbi:MAG: hypothetical protein SFY69_13040 [Planctomycetota bacterium]|nr:hypothetical protein [Planctomycetota bacterium]
MRIATNATRAQSHTRPHINERIRRDTERRVRALAGRPDEIRQRMRELDLEWDVERCLETGSAALTLTGLVLGTTLHRRWLLLSAAVQGFFMQHALQGWCPPLPLFRSLGVRTQREIEGERHALKALLGQYAGADAPLDGCAEAADRANRTLHAAMD